MGVQIYFELILSHACLAHTLPEPGNVLRRHLLVRRQRLVEFGELDQEPVINEFLGGLRHKMLRHDLHSDRVLTGYHLCIGPYHVVLDICSFYLWNKKKD